MNFLKKGSRLKKLNRGIILAIILFLSLIIYIIFDTISFNSSKPDIESFIQNYVLEIEDVSITPTKYQNVSYEPLPTEMQNEIKDKIDAIADIYWAEPLEENRNSWGVNKVDFINLKREIFTKERREYLGLGYVKKCKHNISSKIKMIKTGPNTAGITFSMEVTYEYAGNPHFITMVYGNEHKDFLTQQYHGEQKAIEKPTDEVYLTKLKFENVGIIMAKEKGVWKIREITGWHQNILNEKVG